MKFITITLFIFLIHVSAAVVNSIGLTEAYSIQPSQSWLDTLSQSAIEDDQYFQSSAVQQASSNFGFGDFVKGFAIFTTTLAFGIVAVPYTLIQFGMPTSMAVILSAPIYLIYLVAISQFISNRATKGMN